MSFRYSFDHVCCWLVICIMVRLHGWTLYTVVGCEMVSDLPVQSGPIVQWSRKVSVSSEQKTKQKKTHEILSHTNKVDFDGLVQERRNSIANALELRLSCTNSSIYWLNRCIFQELKLLTPSPQSTHWPLVDVVRASAATILCICSKSTSMVLVNVDAGGLMVGYLQYS